MAIETLTIELPEFWASALINGDESGLDFDDIDSLAMFKAEMVEEYGQCWALSVEDDAGFRWTHDATRFGVLACDVATYTFDITDHK